MVKNQRKISIYRRFACCKFVCWKSQITANYNRDAIDAYRIGDLEKALYWSNLSLHSATLQPEIIRLRQRITDEKASVWEQELRRELIMRETKRLSAAVEGTE